MTNANNFKKNDIYRYLKEKNIIKNNIIFSI